MTHTFTGRLAGYAALFDTPDAGGDVIRAGAFGVSLRALERPLPLLWQHRPDQQIGWIEAVGEDARGLRVIARLADPDGASASLIAAGEVRGLSFGYRAIAAREIVLPGAQTGRELAAVDIFEVSVVTTPMQPRAAIHLAI